MADKILSIIIPSYNMEAYLERCLSSLIVDDPRLLARLDVIVVNDGSKDRTSEIAHSYEERYSGVIRVIDKQNGHYGSCINAALPVAQGVYVKILDSDDRYNTVEFERYLTWIEEKIEEGAPDLLINDFLRSDATKNVNSRRGYNLPIKETFSAECIFSRKVKLQIHCIAYRMKIFEGLDYHQTEGLPYTDLEWDTYPLVKVETAAYLPEAVYHYYLGREGQSMDSNVRKKYVACLVKLAASAITFADRIKCSGGRRLYLEDYVKSSIAGMYLTPLLLVDVSQAREILRGVDSELKEFSARWYDYAGTIKYPASTPFGFRYVRAFREGRMSLLYMVFFKVARGGVWCIVRTKRALCCYLGKSYRSEITSVSAYEE